MRLRFAPKVPVGWLEQLYRRDALGIQDEDLVDKVAVRLYARRRDVLLVRDSRVACIGRPPLPSSSAALLRWQLLSLGCTEAWSWGRIVRLGRRGGNQPAALGRRGQDTSQPRRGLGSLVQLLGAEHLVGTRE
jgi:hypothetical protein